MTEPVAVAGVDQRPGGHRRSSYCQYNVTIITALFELCLISHIVMEDFSGKRFMRIATHIVITLAVLLAGLALMAGPAVAADPEGFVIKAVLATPEAGKPVGYRYLIDIEDKGHILIVTQSGQMIRKDGPYYGPARTLFNESDRGGLRPHQGMVIEAVLATPEAEILFERDTMINIEDKGYILIITQNGQIIRKDGPFHELAASLFDEAASLFDEADPPSGNGITIETPGDSDLEKWRAERRNEGYYDHPEAISRATETFCFVKSEPPVFHTSKPPIRDEPLIWLFRISPKEKFRAIWPAGVEDLPWQEHWPFPKEEGRYHWYLGDQGSTLMIGRPELKLVDELPASLEERAALYNDMGCYRQLYGVHLYRHVGKEPPE